MENPEPEGYSVGVLVVSDTVFNGEKEDSSGKNLASILKSQKYFRLSVFLEACVPDEKQEIEKQLKHWTDDKRVNLILTVGGTGFSPRDVTPEATRAVIEKDAPHIASHMVISCSEKTKFAVLSRGVCGIRGNTLILNLPGSSKGSEENFEAVASVLPHAMDQLKQDVPNIVADHIKIQGKTATSVPQSISSPVPSAVTASSSSVPDMMKDPMGGPQGSPPLPVIDEGSQASNAFASSSRSEEGMKIPNPNNKRTMSPPTPNTLPSPGEASTSSFNNSTVTASSPSVPDMMKDPMECPQVSPPLPVIDEGSQASNAFASSSRSEEGMKIPNPNNKRTMSPPTPNTLPSPGEASTSSFNNEFESALIPKRPRTFVSQVKSNHIYNPHRIKLPDGRLQLYDLSDDSHKRVFLNKLIVFQEERGKPLFDCPKIGKKSLDLYRIYLAVRERGGFVEVTEGRYWNIISDLMGIGASSGAAYTLRRSYVKYLLPFECKFDRGGIDPGVLFNDLVSNVRRNARNDDNQRNE